MVGSRSSQASLGLSSEAHFHHILLARAVTGPAQAQGEGKQTPPYVGLCVKRRTEWPSPLVDIRPHSVPSGHNTSCPSQKQHMLTPPKTPPPPPNFIPLLHRLEIRISLVGLDPLTHETLGIWFFCCSSSIIIYLRLKSCESNGNYLCPPHL